MWNKSFISNCIYKTKQGKVHLKVNELGYKIIIFLFLVPFIANTQETINVGLVDNNEMAYKHCVSPEQFYCLIKLEDR